MYQKKFAVTHVEENCEKILALFDDKSAALEYRQKPLQTKYQRYFSVHSGEF